MRLKIGSQHLVPHEHGMNCSRAMRSHSSWLGGEEQV